MDKLITMVFVAMVATLSAAGLMAITVESYNFLSRKPPEMDAVSPLLRTLMLILTTLFVIELIAILGLMFRQIIVLPLL